MIRKLRRKFIMIAMLSTFTVLAVIVGILNIAQYVSMNAKADRLNDLLIENNGGFPEFFMGNRVDFGKFGPPGQESGRHTGEEAAENNREKDTPPQFQQNKKNGTEKGFGFSSETPYETRYFSVYYRPNEDETYEIGIMRIASVTKEEALDYTQEAIGRYRKFNQKRGYIGNYRYALGVNDNDVKLVVFVDMTRERNSFRNVLKYSLIISAAGLAAVFALVWFFSRIVFKPVEESDRKQKQFITDASHELKTPLTIISANVEVLEMENGENEFSKSIHHQVDRMSGLVEQMVTLTRLDESTNLTMADFSYSDAVRETAENYLPVAEQNGQLLTISVPEGIRLNGDEARIRQMTGLLLDNAVKYASAQNPPAKIGVTLESKGRRTVLQIRNTVSGEKAEDPNRLFERFYRPDVSRNSKKGGSGIGLSIVKSVAEAHKGKVSARYPSDDEIEFTVII